jgi:hypothetical protein
MACIRPFSVYWVLESLIDSSVIGNPEKTLCHVSKSARNLSDALKAKDIEASPETVRRTLKRLGYKMDIEEWEWKERMRVASGEDRQADDLDGSGTERGAVDREAYKGVEGGILQFIEAGIESTNNPAELTIRQSIMDRIVTQGSRGVAGNEWHERFWSIFTTCTLQNISVMNYLKECLSAHFGMKPFPILVNPVQ